MNRILITCPKRCTPYLVTELEELGYEIVETVETGVFTKGTLEDCWKLNLQIRSGLRVLYMVADFMATNPNRLYSEAGKLPWENWIPSDGYVCVISSVENDTIDNTQFPRLKLKDAIVDRIRDKTGERPDSGPDYTSSVVFLYWHAETVNIYLDTSGVPLSNRGYRVHPWKAPMRETLAASVLLATGWDANSDFVNPMCGAGTLAIEAALMATGRYPGMLRDNFGFMHLLGADEERFKQVRDSIPKPSRKKLPFKIHASDISPEAIEMAKKNAEIAGVEHLIDFEVCDFRDIQLPEGPGAIVLNPEYGERLGNQKELQETYAAIGDFFKQKAAGYMCYIFTGNMNLAKRIGLRAKRRIEFYNGTIDCRLLEYEMYSGTRRTSFKSD